MIGFIIWIIGLILTIKAAIDIMKLNAPIEKRLLAAIILLLTSWLGLAFYYFYAKDKMAEWLR